MEIALADLAKAAERIGEELGGGARLDGEKALFVRGMLDVLADLPRARMERHLLGSQKRGELLVIGADDEGLAHEAPGNRIPIPVEGDAKGLGDALTLDVVGVEGRFGNRLEEAPLLVRKDQGGHFARLVVDAVVGEGIAPLGGLHIEVEQILESATRPEALADKANRSLDATLFIPLARIAGDDPEVAPCLCVFEEARIEDGRARRVREHHRLHVVEDVDGGDPAEEGQSAIHAAQECAHGLADGEFNVEIARVAERHHEGAHAPRAAGQRKAEVGPVHLDGGAGFEIEGEKRLARRARSERAQPVAHDADTTLVAQDAQPLEDGGRAQLGCVVDELANGRQIRIEDRRARRRRGCGARLVLGSQCAAEDLPNPSTRQMDLLGDGANRQPLDQRQA